MLSVATFGTRKTIKNLANFGKDIDAANKFVVVRGSMLVRNLIVMRLSAPKGWDPFWGPKSPMGNLLASRSGDTRKHISPGGVEAAFKIGPGRWVASVGSPDRHMLLHEYGGVIMPTVSKFLTIPTAAVLRPGSGTPLYPQGARSLTDTFVWPNSKQVSLAGKRKWIAKSDGGELKLLYMLHPGPINERPRHIFRDSQKEAEPLIAEIGSAQMKIATVKANA